MVFFVPLAVAGYCHFMKKKAEREARERLDEDGSDVRRDRAQEIASDDRDANLPSHDSDQNEIPDSEPIGPVKKFLHFFQKLEMDRKEAEQRKLEQFVAEAMKSVDTYDGVDAVQGLNSPQTEQLHDGSCEDETTTTPGEVPNVSYTGTHDYAMIRRNSAHTLTVHSMNSFQTSSGLASSRMHRSVPLRMNRLRISSV
jgi:hypothetical protein